MMIKVCEEQARELLENHLEEAERILKDSKLANEFLNGLDLKVKSMEFKDKYLQLIPEMSSLVRFYVQKQYDQAEWKNIVSITSALIYFLSPNDLIVDSVPELGYIDDSAVIAYSMKEAAQDLDQFVSWKKNNA